MAREAEARGAGLERAQPRQGERLEPSARDTQPGTAQGRASRVAPSPSNASPSPFVAHLANRSPTAKLDAGSEVVDLISVAPGACRP